MKKLSPRTFSERLPVVSIYESDLRAISDVLRQKQNTEIKFEHGDAEYETIEELREHLGDVLRELKIEGEFTIKQPTWEHGTLSIDFNNNYISLYSQPEYELQFRRIKELLTERRRLVGRIPDSLWFMLAALLWIVLLGLPSIADHLLGLSGWRSYLVYAVCLPTSLLMSSGRLKIRRNLIFLRKKHEHQTFLQRHEESLVRAVIAILAAVAGAIATYYLKK